MLIEMGKQARQASRSLAQADRQTKDAALAALVRELGTQSDRILAANALDVADGQKAGLEAALIDRLTLNPSRLEGIAAELRQTIGLPDPVGERFDEGVLPNGLK
ncbi:MAG TPA: gamma-glutamyl-phosphate reductase, partial [Anaerolineales bacterium]|nr:gamma-glutamyl-phosphate reductase [Anaerolineales bacterium]